jgi:hypothetical protein
MPVPPLTNFGLCRIYDAKRGNAPAQGRTLDFWLNHVIYIGPILGGVNLLPHLQFLGIFGRVQLNTGGLVSAVAAASPYITRAVAVAGLAYVAFYLACYWRLSRRGYSVSPQKICLLVSVAVTSIVA